MARGFKDDKGVFHPTDRLAVRRRGDPMQKSFHSESREMQMGKDGIGITKQLLDQAGKFAIKRAEEFRKKQDEIRERNMRELKLRRGAEKRIISSFKRARDLSIKDPVALKNQILIDVPEIDDNPENLRFIEKILNGFLKREKEKNRQLKKAKTQEEKDRIQSRFDKADDAEEKEVREEIKRVIAKEEKELSKKQKKQFDELEKVQKESEDQFHDLEVETQKLIEAELALLEQEHEVEKKEQETELKKREAEEEEKDTKEPVTFAELINEEAEIKRREKEAEKAFDEFLETQKETIKEQNKEEDLREEAEKQRVVTETLAGKLEEPILVEGFPSDIV